MCLVGLDEAGVGPAFGSLWAAAVADHPALQHVKDSKSVTPKRREGMRDTILATTAYGMGEVTHAEIDEYGLGEARRLVFERALDDYVARGHPTPSQLIVDGTIFAPWRGVPYECRPKADATVPCVSAASILAKTTRDAQVLAMCDADPTLDAKYALRSNKGYLSAAHTAGLRMHGYSDYHRRSYRIRALEGA
jgi:ribonuclease HII